MWPCVNTAVSSRSAFQPRKASCTAPQRNGLLVSTTTRPASVLNTDAFANAATNAVFGEISARSPNWLNGWWSAGSSAPVNSWSATSRTTVMQWSLAAGAGRAAATKNRRRPPGGRGPAVGRRRSRRVDRRMETCSHLAVTSDGAAEDGALARNQAARRRRVLDATLALADKGGFEAVQM